MSRATVEQLIADVRAGRMVVIVDDEGRENEGDLVMAANLATPRDVNFMVTHGRGLLCLTLTRERCERLRLPLMVSATDERLATNFTLSIEAAEGVGTGISAHDRAHTIRTAADPEAGAEAIVRPGHVFPLMAQPGGVLTRAGHTEAGCDLTRLAGMSEPAAVIVEILNEDGSMARMADLEVFAKRHDLKIGTVEDLIRYRIARERTVTAGAVAPVATRYGDFMLHAYEDLEDGVVHLALVKGEIHSSRPLLVRVHVENVLRDALGVDTGGGWRLGDALERISREGLGVAVVLRRPENERELRAWLDAVGGGGAARAESAIPDAPNAPGERWTLGVGGQILSDLGVGKMRLMSSPQRFHALGGFGLSVEDYVGDYGA